MPISHAFITRLQFTFIKITGCLLCISNFKSILKQQLALVCRKAYRAAVGEEAYDQWIKKHPSELRQVTERWDHAK
jgi:hypothetical protein